MCKNHVVQKYFRVFKMQRGWKFYYQFSCKHLIVKRDTVGTKKCKAEAY